MKTIYTAFLLLLCSALSYAQNDKEKNQRLFGIYYVHTGFDYPIHSQQLFLDILEEDYSLNEDLSTSTPAYIPTGHSDGIGFDWSYRKTRKTGDIKEWRLGLELILHRQGSMHHREYFYEPSYTVERHMNLVHHERVWKVKLEHLRHPSWWPGAYVGVGAEFGHTFDEWIYVFYNQMRTPLPGVAMYDETPDWAKNPYKTALPHMSVRGYFVTGFSMRLGKKMELSPQFGVKTGYNQVRNAEKHWLPLELELKAALRFKRPAREVRRVSDEDIDKSGTRSGGRPHKIKVRERF